MLHVANAQDAPRNRETYATPSHHVPINIVSALTEPPSPRLQHGKWKDLAADFDLIRVVTRQGHSIPGVSLVVEANMLDTSTSRRPVNRGGGGIVDW